MNITIKQVMIDGELLYEAKCAEFPYLVEYADTYEEAESLIRDAIDVTMEYLDERWEYPDEYPD